MNNESIIFLAWLTFMVICGLILWRNTITYNSRKKAANVIHTRVMRSINEGNYKVDEIWDLYEKGPSYDAMMFDLTKWTPEQFYPWLKE